MKISQWKFEQEMDSLINAALTASSEETAKQLLIRADNKIDGYDDIPENLQNEYHRKVEEARQKL